MEITKHFIGQESSIHDALAKINQLEQHMILFVVDEHSTLLGTLSDGDIRRALVEQFSSELVVSEVMNKQFCYIESDKDNVDKISEIRRQGIDIIPVLDQSGAVLDLLNLDKAKTVLPVHAVLMAGGEGRRLRPLTEKIPKPLLKIGGKPIIQYNLELLARYGVKRVTLSVRYLGDQIKAAFGDGSTFGWELDYVEETKPLGTMGALRLIRSFTQKNVLVMNSDVLTNIDFEDFYLNFRDQEAAMSVATVPHVVTIPYGVLETRVNQIEGVHEKPTFTHYSNAGIYIINKQIIASIPTACPFNATDMMDLLISEKQKLVSYPLRSYWLDIGQPDEFAKAEEDIKHIKF